MNCVIYAELLFNLFYTQISRDTTKVWRYFIEQSNFGRANKTQRQRNRGMFREVNGFLVAFVYTTGYQFVDNVYEIVFFMYWSSRVLCINCMLTGGGTKCC